MSSRRARRNGDQAGGDEEDVRRPPGLPYGLSPARFWFNVIFSGLVAVWGLLLLIHPELVGSTQELRPLGGMLAVYGLARAFYFYLRLRRASPDSNRDRPRSG